MKTITINVKKWCRDQMTKGESHCALGFCKVQMDPHLYETTDLVWRGRVAYANDIMRGEERRVELRKLFKQQGFRLVFK